MKEIFASIRVYSRFPFIARRSAGCLNQSFALSSESVFPGSMPHPPPILCLSCIYGKIITVFKRKTVPQPAENLKNMLNHPAKDTVLLRKSAVAYRQHTASFVARRALRALTAWPFQSYFSKGNGVTAPFRGVACIKNALKTPAPPFKNFGAIWRI
jgi:hypothetical protein